MWDQCTEDNESCEDLGLAEEEYAMVNNYDASVDAAAKRKQADDPGREVRAKLLVPPRQEHART